MKVIFFIVLCLSPVIWSNNIEREEILKNWSDTMDTFKSECIKESGVNKDDVEDLEKLLTFPNYENFKCYLKCQQQRNHFLDAEGNIDGPAILNNTIGLNEDIINSCTSKVSNENDLCNKSYSFSKCCIDIVFK
ncbi:hypothetical protein FQA39_LY18340 [Lamprigera yunnana]|nr:hypothetical protein FQA39_LY18340 [Lamprigera yunnana]